MKVTGFTIARNAEKYGYPIVESIKSILPICDEFLVSIGKSEDDTIGLIKSIGSDKIKIMETVWNETLMDGGKVLAVETDKAFQAIGKESDWCFYIQADEVVHEKYLESIRKDMERYKDNPKVEALLFNYHHFYDSYHYIGASSRFYKKEIRLVKNNKSVYSYRDAQGFRVDENRKLRVKNIDAYIYHYGWVRPPEVMYVKQANMSKYYHSEEYIKENFENTTTYDYSKKEAFLVPFTGTHPALMQPHADAMYWDFDLSRYRSRLSFKDTIKKYLTKLTGINPDYANYTLV